LEFKELLKDKLYLVKWQFSVSLMLADLTLNSQRLVT